MHPLSRHRERGVVLLVVLFFALLLTSGVATFLRRATVDAMISRNREAASRAEAVARGGVRLAKALLLADLSQEALGDEPLDSARDLWHRVRGVEIPAGEGATLRLSIEDAGTRLNLNSLFRFDEGGVLDEQTEPLLQAVFEKVIDELPVPPGEKNYDVRALVEDLIDWVDEDDVRLRGGPEDDYYQRQDPPYRAANRPLLSVEELRLVEGFDGKLVEGLRPYVTVYPYVNGGGINPNTASPHVLALLFFNDGVDLRLAQDNPDPIREILKVRQEEGVICAEGASIEGCTPIRQIVTNAIYPPPTFKSDVFLVTAEASVGDVRRRLEAAVDRSQAPELRLLSWRMR